jgi:hypothetical protein
MKQDFLGRMKNMKQLRVEEKFREKIDKRAKSLVAMGLVSRDETGFKVYSPSLRGKQKFYQVWKDENKKIRCNCLEYEEFIIDDPKFRCEHILAVKYFLNKEEANSAVQKAEANKNDKKPELSKDSQQTENLSVETLKVEKQEMKKGEIEMKKEILKNQNDSIVLEISKKEKSSEGSLEEILDLDETKMQDLKTEENADKKEERGSSVVDFLGVLRRLREQVDPRLVKQREGWRDEEGNTHYVDYIEWHTVADILDEKTPNWSHSIREIKQIGNIVTVIVAITIDGITREGIGTGAADSEMGIKKAEHDALKRAAVKFGVARDLYKKESEVIEKEGSIAKESRIEFPINPLAKSASDLPTSKQFGLIRVLGREIGIDVEKKCQEVLGCNLNEISKHAASVFINYLQDLQRKQSEQEAQSPHESLNLKAS